MDLEKFLRRIIYAGLFLVPFLATSIFVFDGYFFPYITGRGFSFRIIVGVMFAAWLILAYHEPKYRPKPSPILYGSAAFVAILTLATLFGENPSRSFWSNFERMEGLLLQLHLFAYFIVASSVLYTDKLWRTFLNTTLAASVWVGCYGLAQLIGTSEFFHERFPGLAESYARAYPIRQGGVRLDGPFGNAIYLAVYAMFHIFLAAFMLVRANITWKRAAYVLIATLNFLMLYHTATRGAMIGLVFGGLVTLTLLAFFEKRDAFLRKMAAGMLGALVVAGGMLYVARESVFVQESPVLSRMMSISLADTTTRSRFLLWNMTMEGVRERPILGYGPENYNLVFNANYDPNMHGQEQWFDRSHNVFLDWLVAGGILGLGAYLYILYAGFGSLWRRRVGQKEEGVFARMKAWFNERVTHSEKSDGFTFAEKSILTGLLAAYILQGMTVFDNLMSYVMFFTVLAYIHAIATQDMESVGKRLQDTKESLPVFAGTVVVLAVILVYAVNIPSIRANKALAQAVSAERSFSHENVRYFEQALEWSSSGIGKQEVREQLVQAALNTRGNPNIPENVRLDLLTLAGQEVQKQVEETPNDARYTYFAGTFFVRAGQYDIAERYVLRSLELSPRKQQFFFELVTLRINQERYEEALEVARAAYELAPEYRDAGRVYGLAAIYAGDMQLADEILVPLYGTREVPDDAFVRAYSAHGQYDVVLRILETRVEEDPENIQFRLVLAQQYRELGEGEKAIEQIERVMELDPNLRAEGERYIREIQEGI